MRVLNRIYEDYLMPSRIGEYERLLEASLAAGYHHVTLPEHYNALVQKKPLDKCFIHRHDVDTDPSTMRLMFEAEKRTGVRSSYYFRLSTLDFRLMREIREYGSEVGYHYEELAAFCKDHHIRNMDEARKRYDEIREIFVRNLQSIEKGFGYKIRSIASHGDFVNRLLGVSNFDFISRELMDSQGIEFECYDPLLINSYSVIMSDTTYPLFYKPMNPFEAIRGNHQVLYLLTHPRHWRSSPLLNTADNLRRAWEGINYQYL